LPGDPVYVPPSSSSFSSKVSVAPGSHAQEVVTLRLTATQVTITFEFFRALIRDRRLVELKCAFSISN
jgi:hypothetical protein